MKWISLLMLLLCSVRSNTSSKYLDGQQQVVTGGPLLVCIAAGCSPAIGVVQKKGINLISPSGSVGTHGDSPLSTWTCTLDEMAPDGTHV